MARHRDENGDYLPHQADEAAQRQRERPRESKLAGDPRLRAVVQRKLNCYWSPEQVAGWLKATHPWDRSRRVCAESIYRALLVPGAQSLHLRYTAKLRTGRKLRRARYLTRAAKGGPVRNMTMIQDRPQQVADRVQPGHWEGDLVIGLDSRSAMITLRERVTHYGLIINLPVDHTALTVKAALVDAFAGMPAHLRRTLTWDQGSEMARHQEFAAASGLAVYFAERSSPWQRGANENFNGLARQFFPYSCIESALTTSPPRAWAKITDLCRHNVKRVTTVTRLLNDRPRKTPGYRTPRSLFPRRRTRRLTSNNTHLGFHGVSISHNSSPHCCCVDGQNSPSLDANNRLTNATGGGAPALSYSYDAAGNRTSTTSGSTSAGYTYDAAGGLSKVGTTTVAMDGDGNLTTAGGDTYSYNAAGALTAATIGGTAATYTVNADGNRVPVTTSGTTSKLVLDVASDLPAVLAETGHRYTRDTTGNLLADTTAAGTSYAASDAQGTIRALTDSTGAVSGTASYDPYGQLRTSTGTATSFGYTGAASDIGGAVNLQAREYNPAYGQFLQTDSYTVGGPGTTGYNHYTYAGDNPGHERG